MKIQEKDQFHGSALTQLIDHPQFKTIKRAGDKYGHYIANQNRHFYIKYRKNKASSWTFQFSPQDVAELYDAIKANNYVFLCLVCGTTTICALNMEEISIIIDLSNTDSSQSITIGVSNGGRCRVSGSDAKLSIETRIIG